MIAWITNGLRLLTLPVQIIVAGIRHLCVNTMPVSNGSSSEVEVSHNMPFYMNSTSHVVAGPPARRDGDPDGGGRREGESDAPIYAARGNAVYVSLLVRRAATVWPYDSPNSGFHFRILISASMNDSRLVRIIQASLPSCALPSFLPLACLCFFSPIWEGIVSL